MVITLAALPAEEIEQDLAKHRPEWTAKQRALAARLANGAIGAARSFDLAGYTAARTQALTILNTALRGTEHSDLFKMTETYRAGADGRDKLERLLRTLYSLLQDLTFLNSSTPDLVRNTDIQTELKKLSEAADFAGSPSPPIASTTSSGACGATCCARCRWMRSRQRWKEALSDWQLAMGNGQLA